jgi:hypothetical protein
VNDRLCGETVTCAVELPIVSWKVWLADPGWIPWLAKSFTVTTGAKLPAAVGVPLINPVLGSITIPGGPLAIEKV